MSKMASALTIVIASAGRPSLLRRTLESLAACNFPTIYRGTVIVENGPKAGAEEVVRSFSAGLNAQYVYTKHGNKCRALNMALEQVGDSLIVFSDNDIRIHPDTLCAYASASAGIDGGQFYGGPTGVDYDVRPPIWLNPYLPPSALGWHLDSNKQAIEKPCFLGFNWAAFAKDIRDAGGFDTNIGHAAAFGSDMGDETEMQARLLSNHVKGMYVPEAMVWHYVPVERCSPRWAIRRIYRYGIGSGMLYRDQVPTIFGFSRWMVREWVRRGFEVLRTSVSSNAHTRFDAYYNFRYFCGKMRGARITRVNSSHSVGKASL